MRKTTIDKSVLPNVWLTWETTKGRFYLNCDTGKKQIEQPTNVGWGQPGRLLNSGSRPRFAYVKYHPKMEMLELAEVTLDTTRKEEVKQWRYAGEKYFLKKDKTVLDENGNVKTGRYALSQYHYSYDFKGFLGMLYRIEHSKNVEEFKKFLGSDTYVVGSGRQVAVCHLWHLQEWYKTKQRVRGAGKQQKLTDKLTAIPVRDVAELDAAYPSVEHTEGRYAYSVNGIIHFERLADGWSVLRVLKRIYDEAPMREIERMYLHDDGTNRIVMPSKDGWVPSKQSNTWGYYRLSNKEEAKEQCARLKYIIPLIENEKPSQIKNALITILRFPELEQMISLGHKQVAINITHSNTPKADLKHMFGGIYNDKENTLLRKAGLTKNQLDKYMAEYNNSGYYSGRCGAALNEMRKLFGNNLSHVDDKTFSKYLTAFVSMITGYRNEIYPQLEHMDIDRGRFIKNMIRIGEKHTDAYRVVNDTLNRYRALNNGTHPEINWYFDSYSDVVRAHDAIDALKRAQDDERRAMWDMAAAERRKKEEEKRAKLDEERKEYEYEDDSYVIRLPADVNEIVREGSMQRICIGGYVTDHSLGRTNLFFLRRKSEPNMPFYAIEMNNNKCIVQIHGFGNKYLGNDPDAIPTVLRWLHKNGITCDVKILTSQAKGYHDCGPYVELPKITY